MSRESLEKMRQVLIMPILKAQNKKEEIVFKVYENRKILKEF